MPCLLARLKYLDVLVRPRIQRLTGLTPDQSEELIAALISLSRKIALRFSWRSNLRDEGDNKFVEAAIHAAAVIVTYNVNDFISLELGPYGWTVMTPQEFLARYL